MVVAMLGISGRTGSSSAMRCLVQAVRWRHSYNRHLLPQPIDTLQLTPILQRIRLLEDAAVPVLKYGHFMSPGQTSMMMARLPYILTAQLHRLGGLRPALLNDEQQQLKIMLLQSLGTRFAELARDCTDQQLVQGILGLAHARYWHPHAHQAAAAELQQRVAGMPLSDLSSATWGMAVSWRAGGPPGGEFPHHPLLAAVAQHVQQQVARLPEQQKMAPLKEASAAATTATEGGQGLLAAQQTERPNQSLDHQSLARLAVAFDSLAYSEHEFWAALSSAATRLIHSSLEAYKEDLDVASPRTHYLHRTLAAGEVQLGAPHERRQSKYVYRQHLKLVTHDFQLTTLGPVLRSVSARGRAGVSLTPLLQAATQQLVGGSSSTGRGSSSLPITPRLWGTGVTGARQRHLAAVKAGLGVLASLATATTGTQEAAGVADLMVAMIARSLPRARHDTTTSSSRLAALALDLGTQCGARPQQHLAHTLLTHFAGVLPIAQSSTATQADANKVTQPGGSSQLSLGKRPTPMSHDDVSLNPLEGELPQEDGTLSAPGRAYINNRLTHHHQAPPAAGSSSGAQQQLAAQVDRLGAHADWEDAQLWELTPPAGQAGQCSIPSGTATHVKTYNAYQARDKPHTRTRPDAQEQSSSQSQLTLSQAARLALVLLSAGRGDARMVSMLDSVAAAVAAQGRDSWDIQSAGVMAIALSHVRQRGPQSDDSLRYSSLLQQLKEYAHNNLHTATVAGSLSWMAAGSRLGDAGLVARAVGQVSRDALTAGRPVAELVHTALSRKAARKVLDMVRQNVTDTAILEGPVFQALSQLNHTQRS